LSAKPTAGFHSDQPNITFQKCFSEKMAPKFHCFLFASFSLSPFYGYPAFSDTAFFVLISRHISNFHGTPSNPSLRALYENWVTRKTLKNWLMIFPEQNLLTGGFFPHS
jgi:hypothetical protein